MDTSAPKANPFEHTVMPADVNQMLVSAVQTLSDGLLLMDRDFRIVFANERARQISRLRPEDLHGPTHWELFPSTVGTVVEARYLRVMHERVQEEFEIYYEPFDVWLRVRAFPAGDGMALNYADISELRRATQEREATAQRMHEVMEATADGVVVVDRNWIIRYMNRAVQLMSANAGDVMGRGFFHAFPGMVYPDSPYVKHYFAAMNEGVTASFAASYGAPLHLDMEVTVRPSDEGIVIFVRDVTQRHADERALRESGERYRALAELGPQGLWTADPAGAVTYVNAQMMEYLGLTRPDQGQEWPRMFLPTDRDRVMQIWAHSVATGEPYDVTTRLRRVSDGEERWWRVRALPVRDEQGAISFWVGTADDIHDLTVAAERLETERAETERNSRELQAVYDTAPVGLALFEPKEFRYLRVNERQAELIGLPRERIIGRRFQEVATTEIVPQLFARVARGEYVRDQTFTTQFHARPGEHRSFNVNYSPVFAEDGSVRAISAAVLEITQLRKAESALVQSEKLAAVGRLAASISHEINNPLEAVTNLLYLSTMDDALSEETRSYLRLAQDELGRVSQIATQTLRFHRQADSPTAVTAAQLVDPVLNLYAGRLINSGVHVEASYSTTRRMLCFENDIRQVLNNLIANAIDAMRTGGRLVIRAHDACDLRSATPGVRIAIADTGHGMKRATVDKIFEPFYTTKGMNGNGLGLWISKGIVERHQGQLRVRSSQDEVHHGTVFGLFLPGTE